MRRLPPSGVAGLGVGTAGVWAGASVLLDWAGLETGFEAGLAGADFVLGSGLAGASFEAVGAFLTEFLGGAVTGVGLDLGGAAGLAAATGLSFVDLTALFLTSGLAGEVLVAGAALVFGFTALEAGLDAFLADVALLDFFGADLEVDMEQFGKSGGSRYNSPIMGQRL